MGKIVTGFTMSLDGFIAGPGDDISHLFKWFGSGDTPFPLPETDLVFQISRASADLLTQEWSAGGAMVTGRRDFEVSEAWGGKPPYGWPTFIVSHRPAPPEWVGAGSPFTFVREGIAAAIEQARAVAGERDVVVGGTTIVQQCLQAGLIDEINIDLASMLLGDGISLFGRLGIEPLELERIAVVEGTDVTHLRYRVVRPARDEAAP